MPMDLAGLLRRLLTDSHIYFALKVLLAILGLLAFTLATGNIQLTVLLSLGVVAGAIAETDDSLWGRLKNLAMTLICRKMLAIMATSSTQKPTNNMPPMKERSRLVVRA